VYVPTGYGAELVGDGYNGLAVAGYVSTDSGCAEDTLFGHGKNLKNKLGRFRGRSPAGALKWLDEDFPHQHANALARALPVVFACQHKVGQQSEWPCRADVAPACGLLRRHEQRSSNRLGAFKAFFRHKFRDAKIQEFYRRGNPLSARLGDENVWRIDPEAERRYGGAMRGIIRGVLLLFLAGSFGCDGAKDEGGATASATAKASAKPTASATATASASAAPTDPLANHFTGKKEGGFAFLRMKGLKGEPVMMRLPPHWTTNRDDPSIDYVDSELKAWSQHSHSHIWVGFAAKGSEWDEKAIKFNCQRVGASDCAFGDRIDGVFGEDKLQGKIAKGTCKMFRKPSEVYWLQGAYDDKRDLVVIASIRKDVYPKREGEMVSMVRSIKINR
jgi:hypothetical protein